MSAEVQGRTPPLPGVTVVVPTHNGRARLPECLAALDRQDHRGPVEVVVVDDASTDGTADVARRLGARVVRADVNVGPGQARNLGVAQASHTILAFTDDDCRPEPGWLTGILGQLDAGAAAVCGLTLPAGDTSILLRYLRANNVMLPLSLTYQGTRTTLARVRDYAAGVLGLGAIDWENSGPRQVFSAGSGNLATTAAVYHDVGGFDPRFRFSAEDQDLCRRIGARHSGGLWFTPHARVRHEYADSVPDTLRRAAAYGAGHMVLREKVPEVGLLVFPIPVALTVATLALAWARPRWTPLPMVLVPLAYPRYLRHVPTVGAREAFAYAYLNLAADAAGNVGVLRHVVRGLSGRRHSAAVGARR